MALDSAPRKGGSRNEGLIPYNKWGKHFSIKMKNEKQKRIFEDIYDLIKGGKFENEARKNIKRFIKNKNMKWDGDNNTISLGKHFIIKLQ